MNILRLLGVSWPRLFLGLGVLAFGLYLNFTPARSSHMPPPGSVAVASHGLPVLVEMSAET